MPVQPGLAAQVAMEVTDADTAVALRSGEVAVLGTPRVVALAEEAAMSAVAGALAKGETTVGMRVQLDHLHPSIVGATVTASATLEKVEGRRLTFTVSITDHCGLIAAGKVTRVIVDTEKFLDKNKARFAATRRGSASQQQGAVAPGRSAVDSPVPWGMRRTWTGSVGGRCCCASPARP